MNTPTFTIRLRADLREKLTALAEETGRTLPDLIHACIDRAFPYVEAKARESKQS